MSDRSELLRGKVAIVTGSSRGIGAAAARLLAAHGAAVTVNYHQSEEAGRQVVEAIAQQGGNALLLRADVTSQPEVEAMVAEVERTLGPVDILVNNASISFPVRSFAEYSWEDFERKLVGELRASFLCCKAVVPGMIARKGGCIVNVSSGLSRSPGPGFVAHATAKSGLDAFSKSLAFELGPHGIRVNVVAPGLTRTDATAWQSPEMQQAVAQRLPLRRIGEPDDVAGPILFCCLDDARYVTGCYIPVSGGGFMP